MTNKTVKQIEKFRCLLTVFNTSSLKERKEKCYQEIIFCRQKSLLKNSERHN